MPAIYQGDKKIVDRYVGETLITRAYQGDKLIFDAYSELSGTLPLYVRSRASQVLKNYIIYGTASGAGVETENMWGGEFERGTLATGTGATAPSHYRIRFADFFYLDSGTYTFSASGVITALLFVYDATTEQNYQNEGSPYWIKLPLTFTVTSNRKIKIVCRISDSDVVYPSDITNIMLTPGSTAPSSYIPYGYKLPITVTSNGTTTDYPVYIGDSQLGEEEYVDYESGKVYKRLEISGLSEPLCGIGEYKDTLDLSTGVLTRRIAKLVLTGEKSYYKDSASGYLYYMYASHMLHTNCLCSHLRSITGYPTQQEACSAYNNTAIIYLNFGANVMNAQPSGNTAAGLKEYISAQYAAGTPVTVWYVLGAPTTETITVPSGLTGTIEGYLVQDETPIPTNPIYPTSNGTKQQDNTYSVYTEYSTPTDPPVPLPDITLPQAEVTIDIEGDQKPQATVKGRINSVHYAVHYAYSINADTAEITYLADNKNFTPASMGSTTFDYGSWENAFFMPRPCMLKSNGKVDYYLDPNDYSKKLDGTASDIADPTYDGNVMLEFPKIYYKFEPTGDDGEGGTFHCSNVKLDDSYECWCNYDANNNEIDHFYVHAYNAVILDGKMRSLSGYALTQENGADTTTGPAEIAAARANNQNGIDEWYTYLISDHQLLTHLATLMCKHVNHQAKFGRGLNTGSTTAKRAYVTGTLNDKGLFWGDTSTDTQGVKIFGIENFYACVWKRAAGLIGTSTGYSYKLTHGTKDGSTATSFNTTGSGYKTIAITKPANGYVTTMHYEANGFWIPATTGTNRYGDYYYTGSGYTLVGGASSSGSGCGSWWIALYNGVSDSYWGFSSALSCKPKA